MLPRPTRFHVRRNDGRFTVSPLTSVTAEPGLEDVAARIKLLFRDTPADAASDSTVHLHLDETIETPEAYRLEVDAHHAVISSSSPQGFFYGALTLVQIVAAGETGAILVEDAPRYPHRGLVLDVARQFLTVDEVLGVIDRMAMFKLNRLHLHLTDDQGWRIEVPNWPLLTEVGGRYSVEGRPGGFYTLSDWQRIVTYAADRFVDVIPEIDMPGHVNAALVAYPHLAPEGMLPEPYFGQRVGFSGLNLADPACFEFARDVLTHLCRITPGPLVHIGGDECFETSHDEYTRFMTFAAEVVLSKGKTPIGWQEAAGGGDLATSAIVQYWGPLREADRNTPRVRDFVARGGRIIMSPADRAYLDVKPYESFPNGTLWFGRLDPLTLADSLLWDPAGEIDGVGDDSIVGVEAALWTEFVATAAELDQLLLPRLAAVAEVAWSTPAPASGLDDFRERIHRLAPAWRARGVGFDEKTLTV